MFNWEKLAEQLNTRGASINVETLCSEYVDFCSKPNNRQHSIQMRTLIEQRQYSDLMDYIEVNKVISKRYRTGLQMWKLGI
jgi:hypothetical protein